MDHYWSVVCEWNDQHFPNWRKINPVFHSNALAGESGEVCNAVKHFVGGGTNLLDHPPEWYREKALKESVDVFIYLVLTLGSLGYSFSDFALAFDEKIQIITDRMANK